MNVDIRLALGFFDHPKTKKLRKRFGDGAVLCLLRLWMWSAENRADGKLTGLDSEDIELAADWDGDDGKFTSALLECGWLDDTECGYVLHGWEEHQAYASKSEERSDRSRLAKLSQVNAEAYAECQKLGKIGLSQAEYEQWKSYVPAKNSQDQANAKPVPSQSLGDSKEIASQTLAVSLPQEPRTNNQEPKRKDIPLLIPPLGGTPSPRNEYPSDFEQFWKAYPNKVGKGAAYRSWKNQKKIMPPLPELISAIEKASIHSTKWKEGFIPNPSTWLNQCRWEDEFQIQASSQGSFLPQDYKGLWEDE